jgi:hypothetical protein
VKNLQLSSGQNYEGFWARDCAICTRLTKAMFQKGVEGDDYQVELRGSVTTSSLVYYKQKQSFSMFIYTKMFVFRFCSGTKRSHAHLLFDNFSP